MFSVGQSPKSLLTACKANTFTDIPDGPKSYQRGAVLITVRTPPVRSDI